MNREERLKKAREENNKQNELLNSANNENNVTSNTNNANMLPVADSTNVNNNTNMPTNNTTTTNTSNTTNNNSSWLGSMWEKVKEKANELKTDFTTSKNEEDEKRDEIYNSLTNEEKAKIEDKARQYEQMYNMSYEQALEQSRNETLNKKEKEQDTTNANVSRNLELTDAEKRYTTESQGDYLDEQREEIKNSKYNDLFEDALEKSQEDPDNVNTALGNIDINHRQTYYQDNGEMSQYNSVNYTADDGTVYVIPTISDDGKQLDYENRDADGKTEAERYFEENGKYFGHFDTEEDAEDYSQALHDYGAIYYADKDTGGDENFDITKDYRSLNEKVADKIDELNNYQGKWYNSFLQGNESTQDLANRIRDGYQFGDVTGSAIDVGKSLLATAGEGVMRFVKPYSDLGTSLANGSASVVAQIADWAGADEFATRLRGSLIQNGESAFDKYFLNPLNENSVTGSTTDNLTDAIAQSYAMQTGGEVVDTLGAELAGLKAGATSEEIAKLVQTATETHKYSEIKSKLGIKMPILSGVLAFGNNMAESYSKEGYKNWEVWLHSLGDARIQMITEGINSLRGVGGSSFEDKFMQWGEDDIVDGLQKTISRVLKKSALEGIEEDEGDILDCALNNLIGGIEKITGQGDGSEWLGLSEIAPSKLIEDFTIASVSSMISEGAYTYTNINNFTEANIKSLEEEYGRELTEKEKEAVKESALVYWEQLEEERASEKAPEILEEINNQQLEKDNQENDEKLLEETNNEEIENNEETAQNQDTTIENNELLNQEQQTTQEDNKLPQNETSNETEQDNQNVSKNEDIETKNEENNGKEIDDDTRKTVNDLYNEPKKFEVKKKSVVTSDGSQEYTYDYTLYDENGEKIGKVSSKDPNLDENELKRQYVIDTLGGAIDWSKTAEEQKADLDNTTSIIDSVLNENKSTETQNKESNEEDDSWSEEQIEDEQYKITNSKRKTYSDIENIINEYSGKSNEELLSRLQEEYDNNEKRYDELYQSNDVEKQTEYKTKEEYLSNLIRDLKNGKSIDENELRKFVLKDNGLKQLTREEFNTQRKQDIENSQNILLQNEETSNTMETTTSKANKAQKESYKDEWNDNLEKLWEQEEEENRLPEARKEIEQTSPLGDRTYKTVGKDTKLNAYQYDNPDVKPFYTAMAMELKEEVQNTQEGTYKITGKGTKQKYVNKLIQDLKQQSKMSYTEINEALDKIINDEGSENNANSKKVEIAIDKALREGYVVRNYERNGEVIKTKQPTQEYLDLINGKEELLADNKDLNSFAENQNKLLENFDNENGLNQAEEVVETANENVELPKEEVLSVNVNDLENNVEETDNTTTEQMANEIKQASIRQSNIEENEEEVKTKLRSVPETVKESNYVSEEGKKVIKSSEYIPISNNETIDKANKSIQKSGKDTVYDSLRKKFNDNEKITLQDIGEAELLIQQYSYETDAESMKKLEDLVEMTAVMGTELGQMVQALSIVKKATPAGQLRVANKIAERISDKNDLDIKISEETKQKILKSTPQELDKAMSEAYEEIADQMPRSLWEELDSFRYLCMLGNPKTHIRNIAGNTAMHVLNNVKNEVSGAIQDVYGAINSDYEKTNTLKFANKTQKDFAWADMKEMKNSIDSFGNKYKDSAESEIEQARADFNEKFFGKSDIVNPLFWGLNKLSKGNSFALDFEDKIGLQWAYYDAMKDYLSANNYEVAPKSTDGTILLKGNDYNEYLTLDSNLENRIAEIENNDELDEKQKTELIKEVTKETNNRRTELEKTADRNLRKAREFAVNQAQEATFHQNNALATKLNEIERNGGIGGFAVKAVLPFKKTPLNILKTGVEYSPIGLATSTTGIVKDICSDMKKLNNQLAEGKITDQEYKEKKSKVVNNRIDKFSKGLTGTALTLLGYVMAQGGKLKGSDDDDEAEFEDGLGKQEYSIQVGDYNVSLDWLSPSAMPLFVGAEIYGLTQKDEDTSMLSKITSGLFTASNPAFETTMLSNVSSAFNSYSSDTSGRWENVASNIIQNYTSSYISSFLTNAYKTFNPDTTIRSTTSTKQDTAEKLLDTMWNTAKAKLPLTELYEGITGKSADGTAFEQLPASYNSLGEEQHREDSMLLRAVTNFINPATIKNTSELNDETLQKLETLSENTDTNVLPSTVDKSYTINKESYRMDNTQYAEAKEIYGSEYSSTIDLVMSNFNFDKMDTDSQAELISDIKSYARECAKANFAKELGLDYESENEMYNTITAVEEAGGNKEDYIRYLLATQDMEDKSEKLEYLNNRIYSADADEDTAIRNAIYANDLGAYKYVRSGNDEKYDSLNILTNGSVSDSYTDYLQKSSEDYFKADVIGYNKYGEEKTATGWQNGSKRVKLQTYLRNSDFSTIEKYYIAVYEGQGAYLLNDDERATLRSSLEANKGSMDETTYNSMIKKLDEDDSNRNRTK